MNTNLNEEISDITGPHSTHLPYHAPHWTIASESPFAAFRFSCNVKPATPYTIVCGTDTDNLTCCEVEYVRRDNMGGR
jgi:hypothetical protein